MNSGKGSIPNRRILSGLKNCTSFPLPTPNSGSPTRFSAAVASTVTSNAVEAVNPLGSRTVTVTAAVPGPPIGNVSVRSVPGVPKPNPLGRTTCGFEVTISSSRAVGGDSASLSWTVTVAVAAPAGTVTGPPPVIVGGVFAGVVACTVTTNVSVAVSPSGSVTVTVIVAVPGVVPLTNSSVRPVPVPVMAETETTFWSDETAVTVSRGWNSASVTVNPTCTGSPSPTVRFGMSETAGGVFTATSTTFHRPGPFAPLAVK